jgi:hypothetical protein
VSPLECLLEALADQVAAKVVQQLTAGSLPGFVDQGGSPLGRRKHIKAVRRLVAADAPGAAIVGRRYLLSKDALVQELAAQKPKERRRKPVDDLADLRAKYGFEKVGT